MPTTVTLKPFHRPSIVHSIQAACCLAILCTLAVTAPTARAAEPNADSKTEHKLVGTWKLLSAKYGGREARFQPGVTTLKHVTPSQFMWASYDKNGTVTRAAGGDYTLKGEVYEETPRYGLSSDFDEIKGKPQTFKWNVEGNRWIHIGKLSSGLTIDEVWERVDKK
jgi:hypothetical protein